MRRVVTALVSGLLIVPLSLTLRASGDEQHAGAAPCTVRGAVARTVAELGADPAVWSVERLHAERMTIRDDSGKRKFSGTPIGYAEAGRVHISDRVDCWMVPSIVHHEWMHLQPQTDMGGYEAEVIADCGSKLLGSTYLPYVARMRHDLGHGCTGVDYANAATVIDGSPDRGTMRGACRPGHCPIRHAWIY